MDTEKSFKDAPPDGPQKIKKEEIHLPYPRGIVPEKQK